MRVVIVADNPIAKLTEQNADWQGFKPFTTLKLPSFGRSQTHVIADDLHHSSFGIVFRVKGSSLNAFVINGQLHSQTGNMKSNAHLEYSTRMYIKT